MSKTIEKTPEIQRIPMEFSGYPQALKKLPDAPPVLCVKGNLDCLNQPAIAVVGTRTPTQQGLETARKMGNMFAELGFIVVSGLARGCDTAAHKGCLEAGGVTVAVLAHGLDFIYPPENLQLAKRIITTGGCLLSEYPEGTSPHPAQFVRRNRIVTALGGIVLAVQPGDNGGTAHAIRFARAQGGKAYLL